VKISVVTVSYNAQATIGETMASVAAQNWPDFEHIVIDGQSTDDTVAIIERHGHPRLRIISEPDAGMYDAMNKGLRLAAGDYVGFLNADDFFSSDGSLALVAETAARTGADCILGDTAFVDQDGRPKGRIYSSRGFRKWWLRIGAMPPHPSFYARADLLRRAGGFDTRYRIASDFDLVARLILVRGASWARIGKVITCFRTGGLSTTNAAAKRVISREMASSLKRLGQPLASAAVHLRYPIKLLQVAEGLLANRKGRG
jgi:glycosyltransferase involved in cell wall biosynthesis